MYAIESFHIVLDLYPCYVIFRCHDLNAWDLWESLFSIVKGGMDGNVPIPEEVSSYLSKILSGIGLGPRDVQFFSLNYKITHVFDRESATFASLIVYLVNR